jgi:D-glycero-alpha-D-manno-heptose-7-phosphate kinase
LTERELLARAPARIDLAGGTLDIWPLSALVDGALTVNLAIDLPARARVRARRDGRLKLVSEDLGRSRTLSRKAEPGRGSGLELLERLALALAPPGGVELRTRSSVPAGSGLGGSSALAVAVAGALARLSGRRLGAGALRDLVRDHETRVLGLPAGIQDHEAAIHGGLAALHLEPGAPRREALPLPPGEIESRLVLVYSGRSRFSGTGNWAVVRARVEGDRRVARALGGVARAAGALRAALLARDWEAAAEAMRSEWSHRRRLAPEVAAGGVSELVALGRRCGALAGKVCGAGGGGCLVFLAAPDDRERVARAFERRGLRRLDLRVARRGLRISARRAAD